MTQRELESLDVYHHLLTNFDERVAHGDCRMAGECQQSEIQGFLVMPIYRSLLVEKPPCL